MKERIISGIAIIAIVACILCAGYLVSPFFISCFLSCISIAVVYELFHNVAKIKSIAIIAVACIYNATTILMSQYSFEYVLYANRLPHKRKARLDERLAFLNGSVYHRLPS